MLDAVFEMMPGHPLPKRETSGAACFDLRAYLPDEGAVIPSGGRLLIPAGFRVSIPEGWEMQIRPRSGLALKHGVTVLNAPGTIDEDYPGSVGVILINTGREPFGVSHGDRIAQAAFYPVFPLGMVEGSVTSESGRCALGFGSTGVK